MHSLEEIKKWLVIADFSPGPGEIYVPNLWHFKQAPHRNYIWEMPAHLRLISCFHPLPIPPTPSFFRFKSRPLKMSREDKVLVQIVKTMRGIWLCPVSHVYIFEVKIKTSIAVR